MNRKQEIRKDQAILEHLVNKYGKDDVVQYINEGRFGDFVRKAADTVKGLFKKVGDTIVAFFGKSPVISPVTIAVNYHNGNLPAGVTVLPSQSTVELAAEYGIDIDRDSCEEDFAAIDRDAMKKANAYWRKLRKFVADHDGLSESYMRKYARKNQLFEYNHPEPVERENFLSLKADDELGLVDIDTERLKSVIKNYIRGCLRGASEKRVRAVPMIWGAPGIGKTAIIHEMLKELEEETGTHMEVIETNLATMMAEDFVMGVPNGGHTAIQDIVKSWLPMYEVTGDAEENARRDEVANRTKGSEGGGVLFLDEFSRANKGVMDVLMKMLDERMIGGYKLGSKWAVICAGNRIQDMRDAEFHWEVAYARRVKQYNFIPSFDSWKSWAKGKGGIDPDIIDFLENNPDAWYLAIDEANNAAAGATPASWTKLSDEWQDLAMDDPEWATKDTDRRNDDRMEAFYGIMGRDVKPASKNITGWNGKPIEGAVGSRLGQFLELYKYFPAKKCTQVWEDGANVKPTFKFNMGIISNVIKNIIKMKPDPTVPPTADEFYNFGLFIKQFGDASLMQAAIQIVLEHYKKIASEKGGMPFIPFATPYGGKDFSQLTPEEQENCKRPFEVDANGKQKLDSNGKPIKNKFYTPFAEKCWPLYREILKINNTRIKK